MNMSMRMKMNMNMSMSMSMSMSMREKGKSTNRNKGGKNKTGIEKRKKEMKKHARDDELHTNFPRPCLSKTLDLSSGGRTDGHERREEEHTWELIELEPSLCSYN
jgi:hypothetical protein